MWYLIGFLLIIYAIFAMIAAPIYITLYVNLRKEIDRLRSEITVLKRKSRDLTEEKQLLEGRLNAAKTAEPENKIEEPENIPEKTPSENIAPFVAEEKQPAESVAESAPEEISEAANEETLEEKSENVAAVIADDKQEKPAVSTIEPIIPAKPAPPRLTDLELRQRHITWALSLGVICVLIAALAFIVTTWNQPNNLPKALMLLAVSIVFFAVYYLAEYKLDIKRTAFAFWVLGVCYFPLTLLSLSFFSILGKSLSIGGSLQYLYYAAVAFIAYLLYRFSYKKFNSPFFDYFSMLLEPAIIVLLGAIFTVKFEMLLLFAVAFYCVRVWIAYSTNPASFTNISRQYS